MRFAVLLYPAMLSRLLKGFLAPDIPFKAKFLRFFMLDCYRLQHWQFAAIHAHFLLSPYYNSSPRPWAPLLFFFAILRPTCAAEKPNQFKIINYIRKIRQKKNKRFNSE